MIVLSIGQTISSGRWRATADSIAPAEATTATVTSCPSSVERDLDALAQAVVRRDEEQDAQAVPGKLAGAVIEARSSERLRGAGVHTPTTRAAPDSFPMRTAAI